MPRIHTGVVLLIFLYNARGFNMGSLINIVVKLSSYKDGDAGIIRKFEHIIRVFKTFSDARRYDYLAIFDSLDHKRK